MNTVKEKQMTELQEVIEAADEHVPASAWAWAWLGEALPHAHVMVEGEHATVEIDGAKWRGNEWRSIVSGQIYGQGEISHHDKPIDGVEPRVIRTVGLRNGGGCRWEVSRLLVEGIYARVRGEAKTLATAMNAALCEPLAPEVRDGVEWCQHRDGAVAAVAGAKWGVERAGDGWHFVRQITDPSLIAASNQLRLLTCDHFSSGRESDELRGPAATRDEAK